MIKKILLIKDKKFYWREKDLNTTFGLIKEKTLEKAKPGSKIKSSTKKEFLVLDASIPDKIEKFKRGPQVMLPKDIGLIITYTGINKNSKVLDAGTGSGFLASYLALYVNQVITYEKRKDFLKIAKNNINSLGLKNVKIVNKDIYLGIKEKNLDLITLDLTEPWKVIKHALKALKPGAYLVSYSPTILQTSKFISSVNKYKNFKVIKTIETLERTWKFQGKVIRPEFRMLGHTGFLTFVRKIM